MAYCQTPGFVHPMVKGHFMSRLDWHSEPRPYVPLASVNRQVCSLETRQTWPGAFHTLGEAYNMLSSLQGPLFAAF